jgi:23S rRNA (pseudouridine1915-N3)-methyltransferase
MKTVCWVIGKTQEKYLQEGIREYLGRIKHYWPFEYVEMNIEMADLSKRIENSDIVVLLDEKGKQYDSVEFAHFLDKVQHSGGKRLLFLIGGAYGFNPKIYERAQFQLSLSKMTFTHQMVRLFFLEQFYRAMTILKNESYHNP